MANKKQTQLKDAHDSVAIASETLEALRSGEISVAQCNAVAKQIANVVKVTRTQLEQNKYLNDRTHIEFLNSN